jgi:DNA-binding transcriptional MerR regulator
MMAIGEVARRAGLRPSAIRYYERLGLLPAPARQGGRRRYGAGVLAQLEVIGFARRSGFTLREIRRLFAGQPYSARLRELASRKLVELDGAIERARGMQALLRRALRCNCLSLEECGRRIGAARGRRAAS